MARILKPMVRGGGWYPSKKWIPLVKNGGYTTQNGGETEPVWATVSGAIASFTTPFAYPLKKLVAEINPVQDLHGYDAPWPAGGGKNKFLIDATTQTINGVTFTVNADGTVSCSGTASSTISFDIGTVALTGGTSYILNGCPAGGSTLTYLLSFPGIGYDAGSGYTYTPSEDATPTVRITVYSGVNMSGKVFSPMVRLSTESDATYTPYSNICPISGWTGCEVTRAGKNLLAKPFVYRPVPSKLSDCFFVKAGEYTFSFDTIGTATSWRFGVSIFDGSGNALSDNLHRPNANTNYVPSIAMWWLGADTNNKTITITYAEDCYTRIWFGSGNTTDTMESTNAQLELGSTASSYSAYTGEAISVSYGQNVYGGQDEVVSGNGISTMGMVDLGTLNWTYDSANARFYTIDLRNVIMLGASGWKDWILCSSYKSALGTNEDKVISQYASTGYIYIKDTAYADATAFKSAVTGVQLVYPLATPTTFTHTPQEVDTLAGQNNVWVDTGDVEVTYRIE